MPQHLLITDKPFAFCKVPKQFFSTHLHFNILQKGHRTQKGQNKVTVTGFDCIGLLLDNTHQWQI